MNKRLIWLAPIALATLLTGCSISVTTTGPIAPSSLVGYTLVFTHERQEGVLLGHSERLHFKSAETAFNANLDEARSWTYSREGHDGAYRLHRLRGLRLSGVKGHLRPDIRRPAKRKPRVRTCT